MPTLLATEMNDLVMMTQRKLGKPKYTEITTDLTRFTAMDSLLRSNRVVEDSGYGVQWDVMVNHAGSAANVGLGASDTVTIVDTMVQATADWRNTTANYSFIGQEIDMNREPSRIVDLVLVRRHACMISLTELMETNFWGPPVALTDEVAPWGVNTWIVKNATEGFNGGAPSGYTSIGLNPTTYSRWKNWTAQYVAVTPDDLFRKWRKAATKTNFMAPVEGMKTFNKRPDMAYYTNYSVIGASEELLDARNDNLGRDMARHDGELLFRRRPVMYVPKLDADTTDPIYGIDWEVFKTHILSGWWLKETSIPNYPGQHTVSAHFLDLTYQWIMKNRRTSMVLATGTTYPS